MFMSPGLDFTEAMITFTKWKSSRHRDPFSFGDGGLVYRILTCYLLAHPIVTLN